MIDRRKMVVKINSIYFFRFLFFKSIFGGNGLKGEWICISIFTVAHLTLQKFLCAYACVCVCINIFIYPHLLHPDSWTFNGIGPGYIEVRAGMWMCAHTGTYWGTGNVLAVFLAWSMTDSTVVFLTRSKVSGLHDQIKYTSWELQQFTLQWAVSSVGFAQNIQGRNITLCHQVPLAVSSSPAPKMKNSKYRVHLLCLSLSFCVLSNKLANCDTKLQSLAPSGIAYQNMHLAITFSGNIFSSGKATALYMYTYLYTLYIYTV